MKCVPRMPSEDEVQELSRDCLEMGYFPEDVQKWIANACIAVFDHYITDSPTYCGKVMLVVWPEGLSFYELFSWEDGKLTKVIAEIHK